SELGTANIGAAEALAEQRRRGSSAGEPLVQAVDPDSGEVTFVPRSEAAGMQPAPRGNQQSMRQTAMRELTRELAYTYRNDPQGFARALSQAERTLDEVFSDGGVDRGDASDDDVISEAMDAVSRGADPKAVAERLRMMGIDPSVLQ